MTEQTKQEITERLRAWDRGESIWTIELGGLGPGYEQAIQICSIEILRDYIDRPLPDESTWCVFGNDTVARIDALDPVAFFPAYTPEGGKA